MTRSTSPRFLRLPAAAEATLISGARDTDPVKGLTHGFYKYPARFSPAFVRAVIETFTKPGDLVLDNHVGGGTTLVEALGAGRHSSQSTASCSDLKGNSGTDDICHPPRLNANSTPGHDVVRRHVEAGAVNTAFVGIEQCVAALPIVVDAKSGRHVDCPPPDAPCGSASFDL